MSSTERSVKDNPCGGKVRKAQTEVMIHKRMMSIDLILLQYDLIQKETFDIATQGFDEDGPHWRLRPLLQSLCWLSTVAKQGQS